MAKQEGITQETLIWDSIWTNAGAILGAAINKEVVVTQIVYFGQLPPRLEVLAEDHNGKVYMMHLNTEAPEAFPVFMKRDRNGARWIPYRPVEFLEELGKATDAGGHNWAHYELYGNDEEE